MTKELKSLYDWFDIQRNEIIKDHENERVLISNNKILGYYPDEKSAVVAALSQGCKVGSFLVQRCITEEEELKMFYNVNLAVRYGY
ncbi:MAG: hypothetical protein IK102_09415 [Treponema sp.]|nr:hypothetical protein [Treponema sp.]